MVFSWPSKNNKGRSSQIFCYKCLECLSPRVKLRMIWCGSVLQLMTVQCCLSLTAILGLVLLRSTISGWLVFFSIWEKQFSVSLVDLSLNQVETVEKALICVITWIVYYMIVVQISTILRSYCVSTESGSKSVLLKDTNSINPNQYVSSG